MERQPGISVTRWDLLVWVKPEAWSITRRSAAAVGIPLNAVGTGAAWAASPTAIPAPHRDVAKQVRQVVAVLAGLTAAEQRTVLRNAAQAVGCEPPM